MSVKMALAKLSATAAGGVLLAGGAVHVAEMPITDKPSYKSDKGKTAPVRYVKQAPKKVAKRTVPKETKRKRRIVRRTVECVPAGRMGPGAAPAAPVTAYGDAYAEECPPIYQVAMAPVPLPPAPPVSGGSSGGVTVIGGSGGFGGFGGGFFGGFF
ncbi:MAG: hypothetical protein ACU0CV_09660, partial [Sagittula sp.]